MDTLSVNGLGPRSVQFGLPGGATDSAQMDKSRVTACYVADEPGNSWGVCSQMMITANAAFGPWQKAAIYGHAVTQKPNHDGNPFVDAIGGLFQGWINGSNPRGRAWGTCVEASMSEDSNGLLFGTEIGLYFPRSKENPNHRDEEFGKNNVWLAGGSPGAVSAGIKFGNLYGENAAHGGWFTGIAIQHTIQKAVELANPVAGSGGLIFDNSRGWGEALRIPNDVPITAYTADGSQVVGVMFVNRFNQVVLGQGGAGVVLIIDGAPHAIEMGPADASGYRTLRVKG
jgi:hypothetical protein